MSAFKSKVTSMAMCHLSKSAGEGLLPDYIVGVWKMGGKHNELKLQFNYAWQLLISIATWTIPWETVKAGWSVTESRQQLSHFSSKEGHAWCSRFISWFECEAFNVCLCSCLTDKPCWCAMLHACMHGLCAMTNNEINGVLLTLACSMMIKYLLACTIYMWAFSQQYYWYWANLFDVYMFNFMLLTSSPGVGWVSAGSMTSLFCACIAHRDLSVFQYALASNHCCSAVPSLLGSIMGTCNPHSTAVDLQSLSSL